MCAKGFSGNELGGLWVVVIVVARSDLREWKWRIKQAGPGEKVLSPGRPCGIALRAALAGPRRSHLPRAHARSHRQARHTASRAPSDWIHGPQEHCCSLLYGI
jgi:hypothetical protein